MQQLIEPHSYYLYNTHGDVVQLANSTGAVTKTYDYDAFGVEIGPVATDLNPFRYGGEYFDKSSGTYYLRARNYSPSTGRFLTEDSIRSGMNWYTYCGNNPIMYVDPSGNYYLSKDRDKNGRYTGTFSIIHESEWVVAKAAALAAIPGVGSGLALQVQRNIDGDILGGTSVITLDESGKTIIEDFLQAS